MISIDIQISCRSKKNQIPRNSPRKMTTFLLVRQPLESVKVMTIRRRMMEMASLEVSAQGIPRALLTTIGDLFDEADFAVAETGNPDEIILGPASSRQPPPNQNAQPWPPGNMSRPPPPNPAVVTPSKPERSWAQAPAPRPSVPAHNGSNHMAQTRPGPAGPGPGPQNPNPNMRQPQSRPNQDTTSQAAGGQLPGGGIDGKAQGMHPPNSSPSVDTNRPPGSNSAAFFSARAVDMLRDNPQSGPSAAPQFDPHTESPSIRKTAGVDHTKSVPISKPMITGASPASNNTRDFVNPSSDMHRKIGIPGGGGGGIGRDRKSVV